MSINILKGHNVDAKLWTPIETIEHEALTQIKEITRLPWLFKHIAIMPDVHAGKGCVVGSVIATKDAVSPSFVGVDIGCVDKDTEFLTLNGWKKISEYTEGDKVLQFISTDRTANFVHPTQYIKLPCDKFYYIKTKYGVDQMLSAEHKVLFSPLSRNYKFTKLAVMSAEQLVDKHKNSVLGFRGKFLTSFIPKINTALPLTEWQIRVMVMLIADGNFPRKTSKKCR